MVRGATVATGNNSFSEMATVMTEWGLRETHGSKKYKLRAQSVQRLFRHKFYMGKITSTKYPEEVQGQHVPMISEQLFYKVQAILDGRSVIKYALPKRDRDINAEFPLRRIVKCGICNIGLTAGWSKGKTKRFPYYRCSATCTKSIRREELETALTELLKKITPRKETTELFIQQIYKVYHERLARLRTIKGAADDEITRLQEIRRQLIEKNLAGVYSDEIFKEQNALIEDKILKAHIAKEDSTLEKYNIDAVTSFMKTLLADLGETYKRSNPNQFKVLLSSIFPSGLAWNYNGTLNTELSPLYKDIMRVDDQHFSFRAGDANYFELRLIEYLAHFDKLRQVYQVEEEEGLL